MEARQHGGPQPSISGHQKDACEDAEDRPERDGNGLA